MFGLSSINDEMFCSLGGFYGQISISNYGDKSNIIKTKNIGRSEIKDRRDGVFYFKAYNSGTAENPFDDYLIIDFNLYEYPNAFIIPHIYKGEDSVGATEDYIFTWSIAIDKALNVYYLDKPLTSPDICRFEKYGRLDASISLWQIFESIDPKSPVLIAPSAYSFVDYYVDNGNIEKFKNSFDITFRRY